MENKIIVVKEALHEFCHAIDEGGDYDKSLSFIATYFSISQIELEKAYNDFVFSL